MSSANLSEPIIVKNGDNFDDLFILDEDGFLRFYLFDFLNDSFNLESTNFLNLSGISWFYFGDFDFDGNYEIVTQDSDNINQLINEYDLVKLGRLS